MLIDTIDGMDKVLECDIEGSKVLLVEGTSGSLKTAFAFTVLSNLTRRTNTRGYYMSLEESKESLLANMAKMGIKDTSAIEVCDLGMARHGRKDLDDAKFMDAITKGLELYKKNHKDVSCFVLDSLNALYAIETSEDPRAAFFHFIQVLRGFGMLTIIIGETPHPGQTMEGQLIGVEEFISDGVIELGVDLTNKRAKRFIQVRKMRGVRHSLDRFWIESKDGLRIIGEMF